jgi:hypothetical protein
MESSSAAAREAGQQQPARPGQPAFIYYYSTAASFWRGGALVQIEVLLLLYAVGANNISSRRLEILPFSEMFKLDAEIPKVPV